MNKQYSIKEKLEALVKLENNDCNYNRTAKELGINDSTLRSWYIKHKDKLKKNVKKETPEEIITNAQAKIDEHNEKVKTDIIEIENDILKQIKKMVTKTRSLKTLVDSYAQLHEILIKSNDGDGDSGLSFIALFQQQINNQTINNNNHENS